MAGSHKLCSGELRAGHELTDKVPDVTLLYLLVVALPARPQEVSLDAHLQGEIILNSVKHCISFH